MVLVRKREIPVKQAGTFFDMRAFSFSIVLAGVAMAPFASAQAELAGRQQYPQFRVLSGLPGGGFAVLPNGKTNSLGAAALTTPIGYTLGSGDYALGFFNTGVDNNPFVSDRGGTEQKANGSAYGLGGISYRGWHMALGGMILSAHGDSEANVQISPPNIGRLGLSLGVQDLFDVAGAGGELIDSVVHDSSRSFYVVGTYGIGRGSYVSVGKGERRFQGLFGNVSVPVSDRLRAVVEYDCFNWNGGLLYSLGKTAKFGPNSTTVSSSLFLGAIRGKYGTAGISFTF